MIGVEFDAQAVQDAVLGQADALRGALEARIQQKLSGDVLQTRSGALAASIVSSIENDGSDTSVSISSTVRAICGNSGIRREDGGPRYRCGESQGFGLQHGRGADFRKKRAPSRFDNSGAILSRSSLAEMSDEIESGFKQAILEALGQG
jgi:hypothetical protein